jgi:hypothetical protein
MDLPRAGAAEVVAEQVRLGMAVRQVDVGKDQEIDLAAQELLVRPVANRSAHGGLAHVQPACRRGHAALFRQRDRALNCGVFAGSPAIVGPLADVLPVDLYIPGCAPQPIDMPEALLALVEKR